MATARRAALLGGTYTTVLNAANEAAVRLFLEEKISFTDIFRIVESQVELHRPIPDADVEAILDLDFEVKQKILERF